ncbi:MAG: methionyl-tRNA formyltransferase [Chitinivibrionia bacterium]|nr:methionyl-tRNA formyltransferase [Chitinivibrionia bacterium]
MKIAFFGTADFGISALKAILNSHHEISAIITNPPKPAGRGLHLRKSPINIFAEEQRIAPIFTPESIKDEKFIEELKKIEADLFVVVAFSILPKVVFSIPKYGTYNIHAALLPAFRGPAPIQRAIESGAKTTGVSVFRIDMGVDTGDIVLQKECEIQSDDDTPSLYEKLSVLGATALMAALEKIENGEVEYKSQDKTKATKAPLLKKEEAIINWQESAVQIANKIRAFKPFPSSYTTLSDEQIIIEKASAQNIETRRSRLDTNNTDGKIGEIIEITKNEICVQTGDGVLVITELKPAGKRAMSARDFINGKQIKEGIILK